MNTRIAVGIVGVLVLVATTTAFPLRGQAAISSHPSGLLKAYLRTYLSLGGEVPSDTTTKFTAFGVKTKNGKTEVDVVYVSGQGWCGSGGCTMLILEPVGSSFKLLGKVTIVQLPIRILSSTKHGYPDIGVHVQGGGIQPGYDAVLSFDGTNYPENASIHPARKATVATIGKAIIATTANSIPLY